jgi:putative membrane protein
LQHAKTALAAMLLSLTPGLYAAPPAGDVDFMNKAAQAGQMEIDASKLAETKAASGTVKRFAGQMLQDHRAAADDLKRLASAKGVQLPTTPNPDDQKKLEAMGVLSGASFDKQYANEVGVKAHNEAVTLFRKASSDARDNDVREFAKKTLPTLEHHLESAKKMASEVSR